MSNRTHDLLIADDVLSPLNGEHPSEAANEPSGTALLMNLKPDSFIFDQPEKNFTPHNHLINQWNGAGLLSSSALIIKKTLNKLWTHALTQFDTLEKQNPRTKQNIIQELLPYLNAEQQEELLSLGDSAIWQICRTPKHPLYADITKFKDLFTFRTVVVYLFKLRFLGHLAHQLKVKLEAKDVLNPSSFLQNYFRLGSTNYFTSMALGYNPYSWFSPPNKYKQQIINSIPLLLDVTLTEMTKIITFSHTQYLNTGDKYFSHALSHKTFGHFLNTFIIHTPYWLKGIAHNISSYDGFPTALRTKFKGSYLQALTLAYSLDQEQQISDRWQEVITADISEHSFPSARFFKICHELQTLTLLTKVAEKQHHPLIKLISRVMQSKYCRPNSGPQGVLFANEPENLQYYDRIIYNLLELPTTNSYHYMLKTILEEQENLSENGLIYIFTNQKLFIPSQTDRLRSFLKKMKLEVTCDFSELKGRGEIGKYLYIFSKRDSSNFNTFNAQKHLKENCPTFKLNGELQHFAQFEVLSTAINRFIRQRDLNQTPLYTEQLEYNLTLQFFQDVIIEGRLLSANSNNSVNITHPIFFEKITKNCVHLKSAFKIENIQESDYSATELFGYHLDTKRSYPYTLVVDYKNPAIIELKIINSDSLLSFKEEFGTVTYFYLNLLPLNHDISIEVLRSYLSSDIGRQIIQISINEKSLTANKIVKSIENLMIPKFLVNPIPAVDLGKHLNNFLHLNIEQLLQKTPQELKDEFSAIEAPLLGQLEQHPAVIIGKINKFLTVLKDATTAVNQDSIEQTSIFFNPLISNAILNPEKLSPIWPDNPDVFIDIINIKEDDYIGNVNLIANTSARLEIFNRQQEPIINIHSDKKLLLFLQFIIENNPNLRPMQLIQSLKIPTIDCLEDAFNNFQRLAQQLDIIMVELDKLLKNTFLSLLTQD